MWEWLEGWLGIQLVTLIFWTFAVYTLGAAIFIILDNRHPSSTFAWLFLFLLLPVLGVLIYIFFGRDIRPFSRQRHLVRISPSTVLARYLQPLLDREDDALRLLNFDHVRPITQEKFAKMLRHTNLALLTSNNQVETLQDAQATYPRLEEDICRAGHSIHMEWFIWQVDEYTEHVADLLIEKAQAGVEVRILYDALGSIALDWLHWGYIRRLRKGGVQIYSYLNPFFLFSLHTINYRNHRKITVIDGEIGYTGGLNMGKEHLEGAGPYKAWRDTHLRITGEAVAVLQAVFTTSWYNTTREELTDPRYFVAAGIQQTEVYAVRDAAEKTLAKISQEATSTHVSAGVPGDNFPDASELSRRVPVQIVGSGPDSQWHAIQQLYFFMIPMATRHVYIQSPFFIPDPSIAEALKNAALAGIDVRIMCARRDTLSPVPNWAANTYFMEMARAGVQIYLMQSAYMHSKTISIDSSVCSVGTANLDLRSFHTNYEINAVIYDEALTRELEEQFHKDMADCLLFDLEEYKTRNIFVRLRDSVARLFSPLL